ncbi:MAG: hypothetical protein JEY91_06655 [Spirochaetaceae bacterium]|nr:hypothetical protein [Spirochaetaceae bacterium]
MKNQDRYYTNVMPDYYRKLKTFREYYPSKKAEINGTEWEYIDRKKGSETVLFLSGATRTGETNINNLIRYKNRFRIISPSYPPWGISMHWSRVSEPFWIERVLERFIKSC